VTAWLILPFAALLFRRRFRWYEGHNVSMLPTIQPGDRILAVALDRMKADLVRGNIVTFKSWHENEDIAMKRVIGLPGEEIEIRNHRVLVDGRLLHEPYAMTPTHGAVEPLVMGPDEYFLMGDNRPRSCDSRVHGPITRDKMEARMLARTGPFRRAGILE
jgi:signal peptidase I